MLHAMSCRLVSSSVLVVALASFAVMGCSKDKKDDVDAAADATVDAAVADAAADAADAAVVVDAAVAPLATTAAPVRPKSTAPIADPPICQKARAARQRNSPSFPALEAQCKALGGTL
ncbi:MAG: hypothetical protein QOI41_5395 [Myxococcales bacterium]|jgi:hypothetical protein|nr:hypothetical protein [Myxococcales bacterium]